MLLSRNLLNKINPKFSKLTNQQLQTGLNAIGIEVEQIMDNSHLDQSLELVKIINIENHPDSDHLHICTIQTHNNIMQIVCGAKNLTTNVYALLAPIGYQLPNGIIIQERKIRGVVSQGMLCGYNELNPNVSDFLSKYEQESIIMANIDEKLNSSNFIEYFNLNDIIFELSIPSNRNELNGIYFIAYELNAYFNFETKLIIPEPINAKNSINISINSNSLNEYGLLEFSIEKHNFKLDWNLKKYLINSGIHPTNSIADLGNFVTLLFATPVHLFDADKVNKICIENLNEETNILALDDREYKLEKDSIVTKNNNDIIAAIGLIGAKKYAVDENTSHIYMEFANLNNTKFQKYAKKTNINSNSKNLFLKSISTNVNLLALYVTYKYILSHYNFISNISCIKLFELKKSNSIKLDVDEINSMLGIELSKNEIIDILTRTGNNINNNQIIFPYYRQDLIDIFDISEEIIKTIDINKFPSTPIVYNLQNINGNSNYEFNKKIKDYFVNLGFIETKTYNLTSEKKLDKFNLFNIDQKISLANPSSNDKKYLRHNLVLQMLDVLDYNINHKQTIENIFEIQKIQFNLKEANHIFSAILCAPIINNIITKELVGNNIYTAYNIFNNLVKILNLTNINIRLSEFKFKELDKTGFEIIHNNKIIGYIAKINNKFLKQEYKIEKGDWFIINFNLDKLFESKSLEINKINPISEFNPIYKEISFENPNNLNLSIIINQLYFDKNIETIDLYDFYKDESKCSYTISIKIQSYDKTLEQNEISKLFNKCLDILETNGLIIRK